MHLVGPLSFEQLAAAVDVLRRMPPEALWGDEADFLRVFGPIVDGQRGQIG